MNRNESRVLEIVRCLSVPSEVVNDVSHAHIQRSRNPQERVKANPLLATFNFADVNRMEIGFLGQLLLAQFGLFPMLTNAFPENF